MVALGSNKKKKKRKNHKEEEGVSDSPPQPVHCEELYSSLRSQTLPPPLSSQSHYLRRSTSARGLTCTWSENNCVALLQTLKR